MQDRNNVVDLWWDEDALCIEFEDGSVHRFEGAFVKSVDMNYNDESIKVDEIEIKPRPIKSDKN
jgi:hypothetical protein